LTIAQDFTSPVASVETFPSGKSILSFCILNKPVAPDWGPTSVDCNIQLGSITKSFVFSRSKYTSLLGKVKNSPCFCEFKPLPTIPNVFAQALPTRPLPVSSIWCIANRYLNISPGSFLIVSCLSKSKASLTAVIGKRCDCCIIQSVSPT
jgi:hypothetical protein